MEMTVDLGSEAYRIVQAVARQRRQSVSEVLDATVRDFYKDAHLPTTTLSDADQDAPPLVAFPITTEEIKAMIAEDEEWEIARGDPNYPWCSVPEHFEPGYPRVVKGALGLPEVQLRPPSTDGKGVE